MKRLIAFCLTAALMLALLAGCAGKPATGDNAGNNNSGEEDKPQVTEGAVKTGLSVSATLGSSKDAGEEDGTIQTDVTLVAVTVDENGVITSCAIDGVQAKMNFNAQGSITGDMSAPILSKNELGTEYGMGQYSGIGKEWDQQAAALADYVVGKTAAEVQGIAVDESTKPTDADLAASVTIAIGGFIPAIVAAVENAQQLGAQAGDQVKIVTTGSFSAPDAAEGEAGAVQTDVNIAAVTMNGDTITSCIIDAVQAKASFDAQGHILTDLTAPVLSKDQKGADYGMRKVSSIGKEWNEQAAAFAAYVTGKTVAEVQGIAVDESTKPTDADLAASVTISVGGFQALLGKLA